MSEGKHRDHTFEENTVTTMTTEKLEEIVKQSSDSEAFDMLQRAAHKELRRRRKNTLD